MELTGITNKTALVTGAGGGIGHAVVQLLSESGARVIATDIDETNLVVVATLANVRTEPLDVSNSTAVDTLVDSHEAETGPIDIGVNVAGILRHGPVTEMNDRDWQTLFDINAKGVFNISRALARHTTPRRRGSIVTVSSNAAGIPRYGMAAYAASKAAATQFTRSLGLELAPHGIRCNVVAPGSTMTPMQTSLWDSPEGEAAVINGSLDTFKNGIPLGRIATPEDIAHSVLFLLSDQARHITLANLYVDGGATQV